MIMLMKIIVTFFLITTVFAAVTNAQWIQVPASPSGMIRNIIGYDGILYLSHYSQGVYKSTDSMASWQLISSGLNSSQAKQVSEVIFFNGNLYAATVDGIYKSSNAGQEWIKKSNGITIGPGPLYEFCESVFEHDGVLYTGAWNGIYSSTDEAENWTITNVTGEGIKAKNFTEHNGNLFAARESINFPNGYKSSDNGLTWQPLTTISFPTITFFSEPPALWTGTIHGAWLSTDNGLSWEQRSNGLSPDPYNSSFIRINGKLVTSLKFGGSGIYCSSNYGITWENFGEGLSFLNSIEKLILYSDKIVAATSEGLWQRDTSEVITYSGKQYNFLTDSYRLYQNYPNPFNPTTKIEFRISSASGGGFVSLKVFDVLGNEIATLVDGYKPAGNHEVEFNVAQVSRPEISSGVYFYSLLIVDPESSSKQSFVEAKKMILLR
jgi:hypothetical protein